MTKVKNLKRYTAYLLSAVLIITITAVLASCGNNNNDTGDTSDANGTGNILDTVDDMLGTGNVTDDNNGIIEDDGDNGGILNDNSGSANGNTNGNGSSGNTNGNGSSGNTNGNGGAGSGANGGSTTGADENADNILGFIDKIYEKVSDDALPEIGSVVVSLDDTDAVLYNTGLENTDGIKTIVVSEPYIGSIAYSLVFIQCDENADVNKIKNDLYSNINMRKWVCVEAEKKACADFGNDIILVMGTAEQVKTVWGALESLASAENLKMGEKLAN